MIEMLEGVPGSGKSYYAVSERLLKWVRAGRRVYVFVDGFYLDRLALFEGIELAVLQQQITLWHSGEDVKAGLLQVEPGSAVLIDEVQTVFRSKDKTDPALLRWLETHRHRGIDLVLMCQQYGQVTLGVNRLVEATTKFRRLDRFGLKNRYQASVRGNPEELEVIRMFSGKYEPKLYAYYSSYSSASVRETARGGSMLKSPTLLVGVLGLVVAVGWVAFGGWLSGAKPVTSGCSLEAPAASSASCCPRFSAGGACAGRGAFGGAAGAHSRRHDDQTRWSGGVAVGVGRGASDDGGRDRGGVRRHGLLAPGARRAGALWYGGALRRHAIGAGVCVGHDSFVVCGESGNATVR